MLLEARVGQRELAQLCRRLATALDAGIDVRKVWMREAERRTSAGLRRRMMVINDAVARGDSISDGLNETRGFFPLLFREMTSVGEQTGKSAEVYRQLAEHYEHQINLRRIFLAAIAWPMFQLAAAIGVIGLLILVLGLIPTGHGGQRIDPLGLGLFGVSGLMKYLALVAAVAAAIWFVFQAIRRGLAWTRPIQRAVMLVPGIGRCLQTMALARMAWSLHVTMETGMDLRHVLSLSLASTQNARYTDHTREIIDEVMIGREIHEVLDRTGLFPRDFLDTIEVGEQSGQLPESMARLSHQYQDQARRALATLTVLAGFGVWAAVAVLIILMIFRLAMFYIGTINDAMTL